MLKRSLLANVLVLPFLFLTVFSLSNSASAQDLGGGYKCVDFLIQNKKNKVVKFAAAKKAINAKITAANQITNLKKRNAKKASLRAIIANLKKCDEGGYIVQSLSFDIDTEQCTAKTYDATAQVLPIRLGRTISLQISSDNGATWSTLSSGTDNGTGFTPLPFTSPDKSGTYLYRIRAEKIGVTAAGSFEAISALVSPCGGDVVNDGLPQVRASGENTCILDKIGEAYCWGDNRFGAVGDGTFDNRLTPVKVKGGHKFVSLAGGVYHFCALKEDGTAWCWGNNGSPGVRDVTAPQGRGSLGDGTFENRNEPVPVSGGLKFKKLSAGFNHTCGITVNNIAYCWGANHDGQIGDGAPFNPIIWENSRLVPTQVSTSKNYIDIACKQWHSCALTANGQVDCWGENRSGSAEYDDPNQLMVLTQQGSGYSRIELGGYQRCGLLPNGTIQCWGAEVNGSFGNGTAGAMIDTPSNVLGGPYKYLSIGSSFGCAIDMNDDAHCWGYNLLGALGNGKGGSTSENRNSPQLVVGGIKWKHVVTGYGHACGISKTDVLYCWGANTQGQIGNGQIGFVPQSPFQPTAVVTFN